MDALASWTNVVADVLAAFFSQVMLSRVAFDEDWVLSNNQSESPIPWF